MPLHLARVYAYRPDAAKLLHVARNSCTFGRRTKMPGPRMVCIENLEPCLKHRSLSPTAIRSELCFSDQVRTTLDATRRNCGLQATRGVSNLRRTGFQYSTVAWSFDRDYAQALSARTSRVLA
jgi:hypothetical protein